MVSDAELGAIIGGSVAGALVLIGIIAAIVCLCCGKRRRKDRDQSKKLQHTPHTTPSHSQPSSLGHGPPGGIGGGVGVGSTGSGNRHSYPPTPGDPRLPKVGSNGLWLGTPGIYAATPSPAYYYGRPGGKGGPHNHHHHYQQHGGSGALMQPAVMQRASSESRIPQQRERHVPAGPGIYASGGGGGGSQQRIYHSQQLASLTPLYEVVDPRDGSIYDVYQIGSGAGSKTKLLSESTGRSGERHSKKVQRSHSDAHHEVASKRKDRHKASQDGHGHRSSKAGKETAQVHQPKDKKDKKESGGQTNEAFVVSDEKINEVVKEALATDSMKILAKNKTDDEKKVVSSDAESVASTPAPAPAPAPPQDPSLHYTYGGDIYAVPNKEDNKRRSRSENPILARMQDMILEGTQQSAQASESETHEPLVVTAYSEGGPPGEHGTALIQNPIYQEVEEVLAESRSPDLAAGTGLDATSQVAAAVKAAADEVDSGAHSAGDDARPSAANDAGLDDVAVTSAVTSLIDAGAKENVEVDATQVKGYLGPRWSVDTDAATDDLSRAGKHISVTAQAFEFLDTYLSDEEGADPRQSPPSSPITSGGEELIY